jgi:hypothetical protein
MAWLGFAIKYYIPVTLFSLNLQTNINVHLVPWIVQLVGLRCYLMAS